MELLDEEESPCSAKKLVSFILYLVYLAEQISFLHLLQGYSQAGMLDEMVAAFF